MFTQNLLLLFSAGSPVKCDKSDGFLGLVSWYHYLPRTKDGCDIQGFIFFPSSSEKSSIPLILAAVMDDLLRIAAFVAVGFIIVGAIQYITSQGNPEDTGKAQSTIVNAIIGLVVAIIAATFVSFLGNKLGGP